MSVKKRLYLSNILMILAPLFISLIIISSFLMVFTRGSGQEFYDTWEKHGLQDHYFEDIGELAKEWTSQTDQQVINNDLKGLNKKYRVYDFSVFVYDSKQMLVAQMGDFDEGSFMELLLEDSDIKNFVVNSLFLSSIRENGLTTIVVNQDYPIEITKEIRDQKDVILIMAVIIVIITVISIYITNYYLTRFVFSPISHSLHSLIEGVNQISNGNLEWRIHEEELEEFQPIVRNFNEMAVRLKKMVEEEQYSIESRKELIASISHDLRTPLTSVKAYVEGLQKGIANTEQKKKEYLKVIESKSNEIEHIVSQLFLFSKLDVGEYPLQVQVIAVDDYIADFVKNYRDEYQQRGLTLHFSLIPTHALVQIDSLQFQNALLNILENNVKYGNQADNQLWIQLTRRSDFIELILEDNGKGIEEEQMREIFQVFYRTNKVRSQEVKGSGLGLAIASKVVIRLNGKIFAHKSRRGGLAIAIQIPISLKEDCSEENINCGR